MAYLYREEAPLATPESNTPGYYGYYNNNNSHNLPPQQVKKTVVKKTRTCFKISKAILARLIFAVHGSIAIWRVTVIYDNVRYFYLFGTLGCLFLETVLSICIRHGEELKWFSPSVFFYLATVCPSVWFLELDRAYKARDSGNSTTPFLASTIDCASNNNNQLRQTPTSATSSDQRGLSITIDVSSFSDADWLKIFEQALMVILIIGRWLLPKGELTRDQLSQLLLVYIGMAADIIEIFEAFRDPRVIREIELVYTTLALWTWSLMQFTLVLTATRARKPRLGNNPPLPPPPATNPYDMNVVIEDDYYESNNGSCSCCAWCSADIWGILTTLILQDGPFLCLRLTFLFKYNVVSYSNVFFTIKNSLVIVLQVYRTVVLVHYSKQQKKQEEVHLRNGHGGLHLSKSFPDRLAMHRSFDNVSV